jgi:hypothetical protein
LRAITIPAISTISLIFGSALLSLAILSFISARALDNETYQQHSSPPPSLFPKPLVPAQVSLRWFSSMVFCCFCFLYTFPYAWGWAWTSEMAPTVTLFCICEQLVVLTLCFRLGETLISAFSKLSSSKWLTYSRFYWMSRELNLKPWTLNPEPWTNYSVNFMSEVGYTFAKQCILEVIVM